MKIQQYSIFIILVSTKVLGDDGETTEGTPKTTGIDTLEDSPVNTRRFDLFADIVAKKTVDKLKNMLNERRSDDPTESVGTNSTLTMRKRNPLTGNLPMSAFESFQGNPIGGGIPLSAMKLLKRDPSGDFAPRSASLKDGDIFENLESHKDNLSDPFYLKYLNDFREIASHNNKSSSEYFLPRYLHDIEQKPNRNETQKLHRDSHPLFGFLGILGSISEAIKKRKLEENQPNDYLPNDETKLRYNQRKGAPSGYKNYPKKHKNKRKQNVTHRSPNVNPQKHNRNAHVYRKEIPPKLVSDHNYFRASDDGLNNVTENTNSTDPSPDRENKNEKEINNNQTDIFKAIENIVGANSKEKEEEKSDTSEIIDNLKEKFEKDDSSGEYLEIPRIDTTLPPISNTSIEISKETDFQLSLETTTSTPKLFTRIDKDKIFALMEAPEYAEYMETLAKQRQNNNASTHF